MENLGELNILRIPLSNLWDVPAIRQKLEENSPEFVQWHQQWYCRYPEKARTDMLKQLLWALENPTYNFQQILKNVTTPNEDILLYFNFLVRILADCVQAGIQVSPASTS
jgi:hypothetical protein